MGFQGQEGTFTIIFFDYDTIVLINIMMIKLSSTNLEVCPKPV